MVNLVMVARVATEDLGMRAALVVLAGLVELLAPSEMAVMAVMEVTAQVLLA